MKRGQQIATLGNPHGLYDAHLHFEIRKNIEIGMSRANSPRTSAIIVIRRNSSCRIDIFRVAAPVIALR